MAALATGEGLTLKPLGVLVLVAVLAAVLGVALLLFYGARSAATNGKLWKPLIIVYLVLFVIGVAGSAVSIVLMSQKSPSRSFLPFYVMLVAGGTAAVAGAVWCLRNSGPSGSPVGKRQGRIAVLAVVWVLVAQALGGAVWGAGMVVAAEKSTAVKCMVNMKSMGQAIHLYAASHGGKMPGRLDDLEQDGYPVARMNQCRGHAYVYLCDLVKEKSPNSLPIHIDLLSARMPVLWETEPHGEEVNMLFADGHVERLPRGELEGRIKAALTQVDSGF